MRTAVHRTSGFPASAETVFSELQKLQTLQKVAAPWASFVQVQPNQDAFWKAGIDYAFRFRVFGFLPLGIHRIHVVRFGLSEGIYTEERNDLVPLWNHEIILSAEDKEHCLYTDHVELDAGWKTPAVWL